MNFKKKTNRNKDEMIHLTQWANINQKSAIETLNSIDVKIYKDKVVVFGTQDTLTLLDKYYK